MKKTRKMNVLSFVKFQTSVGGLIGLIAGILYAFGGLIIDILVSLDWVSTTETSGISLGTVLAFGALIGMPLIGAAIGLITGLIEAFLFNLFAKWMGWVDLNFEQ